MSTKITTLTYSNIDALHKCIDAGILTPDELNIGKTIAVFNTDAGTALAWVNLAIATLTATHGGRGHPVQSLHAVRRKLEKLYAAEPKIDAAITLVFPDIPDAE